MTETTPKTEPTFTVDPEFASWLPPLPAEKHSQLEENLKEHGCLDPLKVWAGHDVILDGHNRYEICTRLGIPYEVTEIELEDRDAALWWIIRNQFGRRDLTPYQRAELALKLEPVIERKAAERQREHGGTAPGRQRTLLEKSPEVSQPINTRVELSKLAGVSDNTMAKAKAIAEKAPEELKEKVRTGEVSIHAAHKEIRQAEKKEEKAAVAAQIASEPAPMPNGPFRTLVVDPPWPYTLRNEDESHRGRTPYPTMSLEDIEALPLAQLAHEDAVLWLWTTNSFLHEAFHLLETWGFTYKTLLTWNKEAIGLGNYLRNVTEHCLLAIKGRPVLNLAGQTTLISEKRKEHSRKPEAFYQLIENLCPGSKVELFARQSRPGWTTWGAETAGETTADQPEPKGDDPVNKQEIEEQIELFNCRSCVGFRRTSDEVLCRLPLQTGGEPLDFTGPAFDCPKVEPQVQERAPF